MSRALALAVVLLVGAGCGAISTTPPLPTPADFLGIASVLGRHGIGVDRVVSGDAGCNDIELSRTAIGLDARGLDQAEPVRLHVYIFRNRATFERLRQTVDACARSFVTDPEGFESFDISPYVVAAQGPWPPQFRAALEMALRDAAGSGN